MPSPASRAYRASVKRAGGRNTLLRASQAQAYVDRVRERPEPAKVPRGLERLVQVRRRSGVLGAEWPLVDLVPVEGVDGAHRVLYLHGGAYVGQIGQEAWWFAARLAVELRRTVTVALYPLVPFVTAEQLVAQACQVLHAEQANAERLTVVGDSAGGGLALAAAMSMRDAGTLDVEYLVLISPWADVSVSHPDVPRRARRDVMLAPAGLRHFGSLYRGELAADDWRASPLYGSFDRLPPLQLFAAEDDILFSDAVTVHERARAAGVATELHVGERMLHVWPLASIPEGAEARARIAEFIRRGPEHEHNRDTAKP